MTIISIDHSAAKQTRSKPLDPSGATKASRATPRSYRSLRQGPKALVRAASALSATITTPHWQIGHSPCGARIPASLRRMLDRRLTSARSAQVWNAFQGRPCAGSARLLGHSGVSFGGQGKTSSQMTSGVSRQDSKRARESGPFFVAVRGSPRKDSLKIEAKKVKMRTDYRLKSVENSKSI